MYCGIMSLHMCLRGGGAEVSFLPVFTRLLYLLVFLRGSQGRRIASSVVALSRPLLVPRKSPRDGFVSRLLLIDCSSVLR
jgi:hypothetical protein